MRRATLRRPAAARAAMMSTVLLTGIAAMASTTPLTVAASGVCLLIVLHLLWRGDEPPILLLPPLFQWSEVAIWPLSTIWRQIPLNSISSFGADLQLSTLYGLAGVAALAVGLAVGAGRSRGVPFQLRMRTEVAHWRFRDLARVALMAMGAGYAFAVASGFAGPARELLNQASNIKYVGLFMLAYWCLVRNSHISVLAAVMVFEIVFGMTGFFAEFKNPILTLLVAALAAKPRLRPMDIIAVAGAGAVLLFVATFWTVIKPEYRQLLNQGTGEQVVTVPITDRAGYLLDAATSIDGPRFADGFDRLIARHGYTEFLGLTMANVPQNVPHENGFFTLAVIAHVTMPRVLFPSKPPLPSDTEIMVNYTGLPLTWDDNTSISIGYLSELYIDFGFVGGLVASGFIGWLVGLVYRVLRNSRAAPALFTAGFCLMSALPIAYFGTAYAKLMGAFIFSSVIAILTQRRGLPILLPILFRPTRRQRRSGNVSPRA